MIFHAFIDLEEAYNSVGKRKLWDILRMYGMGGHVSEWIRSFSKDVSASVCKNWELCKSWCW